MPWCLLGNGDGADSPTVAALFGAEGKSPGPVAVLDDEADFVGLGADLLEDDAARGDALGGGVPGAVGGGWGEGGVEEVVGGLDLVADGAVAGGGEPGGEVVEGATAHEDFHYGQADGNAQVFDGFFFFGVVAAGEQVGGGLLGGVELLVGVGIYHDVAVAVVVGEGCFHGFTFRGSGEGGGSVRDR